jgi:type II secretory pathway component PulF
MNMNRNGFIESFLWPVCMWLTHVFAGVLLFGVLVFIVPIFENHFDEIDAELPAATITLLDLSNTLVNFWYLILPDLAIVDAAILFGLSQVPPKLRWLRSMWFNAIMLATIILFSFWMVNVAMPLIPLLTLSGHH